MLPHMFPATAQAQIHTHTAQAQPAEAMFLAASRREATMTPLQTATPVADQVTIMRLTATTI